MMYRKPPKISPGLILVQRPKAKGQRLTFGGGGGGIIFREKNCVSRKGSRTLNSKIRPDIKTFMMYLIDIYLSFLQKILNYNKTPYISPLNVYMCTPSYVGYRIYIYIYIN